MATGPHHRHLHVVGGQWQESDQWRTGPQLKGLAPNACTAVDQLQGSRLASCTHAAAKAKLTSSADWRVQLGTGRESVRWHPWRWKPVGGNHSGEICRGFMAAVLGFGFFSGESCWDPAQSCKPQLLLLRSWYWEPQAFFLAPTCLYLS